MQCAFCKMFKRERPFAKPRLFFSPYEFQGVAFLQPPIWRLPPLHEHYLPCHPPHRILHVDLKPELGRQTCVKDFYMPEVTNAVIMLNLSENKRRPARVVGHRPCPLVWVVLLYPPPSFVFSTCGMLKPFNR